MIKNFKVLIFIIFLTILTGCNSQKINSNENSIEDNKNSLIIYTSIFPIYDIVSKISGDKAQVYTFIENGEDAHTFEPTTKQMLKLETADLFFYNGINLEEWIDKIKSSINNKELNFVNLSKEISLIEKSQNSISTNNFDNKIYDPHIWLSPNNILIESKTILESLISKDPLNKEYYTLNYENLVKKINLLDETYKNELKNLNQKNFIVTHNAYSYLCKDYNLNQIYLSNSTDDSETSISNTVKIIDYINENNIKYILTPQNSSSKLAQNIAKETGSEVLTLSTLESLSKEEIENNDDYFSIMYKNLDILKLALNY